MKICDFILEEGKVGVGQLEEHFVDAFSSLGQLLPDGLTCYIGCDLVEARYGKVERVFVCEISDFDEIG